MQQLMVDRLGGGATLGRANHKAVIDAIVNTLDDPHLDRAFVAEAVLLPSESFIGDQMALVDPEAIYHAREALRRDLGRALEERWRGAYIAAKGVGAYRYNPEDKGLRPLKSAPLPYTPPS